MLMFSGSIEVLLHQGIPTAFMMAKVYFSIEQIFHCEKFVNSKEIRILQNVFSCVYVNRVYTERKCSLFDEITS